MNIMVDVDDTLTDFFKERITLIKKYIKDNHLNFEIIKPFSTTSLKLVNWNAKECALFWRTIGNEALLNLKPRNYCVEVLNKLKQQGHRIIIITARNDSIHGDAYTLTKTWLDKNNIPYDKLFVGKIDKMSALKEEKIDLVIEDSISVIKCSEELGIESILISGPQNEYYVPCSRCKRVQNWKNIDKIVKAKEEKKEIFSLE